MTTVAWHSAASRKRVQVTEEKRWWNTPVIIIRPVLGEGIDGVTTWPPPATVETWQLCGQVACKAVNRMWTPSPIKGQENPTSELPVVGVFYVEDGIRTMVLRAGDPLNDKASSVFAAKSESVNC